ncbi:DegV family protein [Athalassotoga saccharophila]|uniref:DegV family protein n=1 Tax=Athalassotoga saccharophila TaxID=1441386 RepID=UPI0018D98596|nr:DegV family protein [Athalassotoga saccharophila]BBJ28716.1 degV domain-containing protein [Athalassotoga saccharophila]
MEKIGIVTDSSCDLDDEIATKYGIHILPLIIAYRNKTYRDRIEIKPQEVYDSLEKEIPKTSMPLMDDAKKLFDKLKMEGYTHVIAITISSALSGTYGMLNTVSKEYDMNVKVIDSKSLSMGLGFIVYEVAKAIKDGKSFEDACRIAKNVKDKIRVFFTLKTLKYLKMGGRIGKVEANMGDLLNVKPIISVDGDGFLYSYAKVLGWRRAIDKMFDIFLKESQGKKVNVAVMNGGDEEEAREFAMKVKSSGNVDELFMGQISPVLVVHTGPGLVGIGFYQS